MYAARIAELKELLAARPERVILLVSHWGVIQQLTGISLEPGELETCEGWTPQQQQPQP